MYIYKCSKWAISIQRRVWKCQLSAQPWPKPSRAVRSCGKGTENKMINVLVLLYKSRVSWPLGARVCLCSAHPRLRHHLGSCRGDVVEQNCCRSWKELDSRAHLEFYIPIKSHHFLLITQEQRVSALSECRLKNFVLNARRCLLCRKLQRHCSFLLKEWQMGSFCQHFAPLSAHKDGVAGGSKEDFLFCTLFLLPVSLWEGPGWAWMLKLGVGIDKINFVS